MRGLILFGICLIIACVIEKNNIHLSFLVMVFGFFCLATNGLSEE